ncbi:MAG: hypothetical protein IJQ58_02225 [Synergistaceae bacterium]|nr:hypothetical protein [Synergistaceae bacterium]
MRKFFTALIVVALLCGVCVSAEVVPDSDAHSVIGGLYSLVASLAMKGDSSPNVNDIRGYFANVPQDWKNLVRFERVNSEIWAGVSVGKYSQARHYLRSHAEELGITDSPGGNAWMGEDFAWIKAGDVVKGKFKPTTLKASQGSGSDSGVIFLNAPGHDSWWQANPSFTRKAAQSLLKAYGVKQPGLHKPAVQPVQAVSIYESVKPSEVRKPDDIHTSRKRNFMESFDMDMGDVIFRPIPNTSRIR